MGVHELGKFMHHLPGHKAILLFQRFNEFVLLVCIVHCT